MVLHVAVEPPRPEEVAADRLAELDPAAAPRLVWEYSGPAGWQALGVARRHAGFAVRGEVRFLGPADPSRAAASDAEGYWLRVRWAGGVFPLPPRVRRVLTNTVWARHVTTVDRGDPRLRHGQREPDLRHRADPRAAGTPAPRAASGNARPPRRKRCCAPRRATTPSPSTTDATGLPDEVWVRWHAVPDLYGSGPRDRHYVLDALSGRVRFGDGISGMAPPPGQNNVRLTYRAGGGAAGNRPAGTLVELRSAIPSVEGVTNLEPAGGGADAEPLDRLIGPWTRGSCATAAARSRRRTSRTSPPRRRRTSRGRWRSCRRSTPTGCGWTPAPPRRPTTRPSTRAGSASSSSRGPTRTPGSTGRRRAWGSCPRSGSTSPGALPATAELWVAGPEWVVASVAVTVVPARVDQADAVADGVRSASRRSSTRFTAAPAAGAGCSPRGPDAPS